MTSISLRSTSKTGTARAAAANVASVVLHSALRALAWPAKVTQARATMRQLAGMNDHELRDIGLSRADIRDATGLALDEDPGLLLGIRAAERAEAAHWAQRIGN